MNSENPNLWPKLSFLTQVLIQSRTYTYKAIYSNQTIVLKFFIKSLYETFPRVTEIIDSLQRTLKGLSLNIVSDEISCKALGFFIISSRHKSAT